VRHPRKRWRVRYSKQLCQRVLTSPSRPPP
jgi:hypothetical protein